MEAGQTHRLLAFLKQELLPQSTLPSALLPTLPAAGDEVCGQILSRTGPGPTNWGKLLEPLPFFEGFKHFLQARQRRLGPLDLSSHASARPPAACAGFCPSQPPLACSLGGSELP